MFNLHIFFSNAITWFPLQYFHLPEKAVARQLGVCLTSLKKICRQNGIQRWPYRKLKSLDKKISKIESALSNSAEDPSTLIMKWELLKQEKKNLPFSNHNEDSDEETRKRITTVANACGVSRSKLSSPSSSVADDSWDHRSPSSTASTCSGASGAETPVLSNVELQQLRKSSKTKRQQALSESAALTTSPACFTPPPPASQQPPRAPRPEQLEFSDEATPENSSDEEMEPLIQEEACNLADYYCRTDSARFYGRNSTASTFLEDSFRVPIFSPTAADAEVFNFYSNPNNESVLKCASDFFCEDPEQAFF